MRVGHDALEAHAMVDICRNWLELEVARVAHFYPSCEGN